jgi:AcrR family transcriptional regulator
MATEPLDPAPATLRSDARRNRRAILQAAARVLVADPHASMQAIAEVAGVSRPTVYRRFRSREELTDAIHREALAETRELLEAAGASTEPAAAALERLIRELAGVVARYPLLVERAGGGRRPDASSKDGVRAEVARAFDALMARGRRDGTLRADLRADVLSEVAIGGLAIALERGARRERDLEQIGAEVAAIVLGGAAAPG